MISASDSSARPIADRRRVPSLDLAAISRLDFEPPDRKRFPCLDLAFEALRGSEVAPAVLNASNEEAVAAFLDGVIPFSRIAATNRAVLEAHLAARRGAVAESLDDVLESDAWARRMALSEIAQSETCP